MLYHPLILFDMYVFYKLIVAGTDKHIDREEDTALRNNIVVNFICVVCTPPHQIWKHAMPAATVGPTSPTWVARSVSRAL